MTRRLTALALALAGCSTLAPIPAAQECMMDEDCTQEGERCAPTRVCVPGEALPPRAQLGFDVQENEGTTVVFRAEIRGCDEEVVQLSNNTLQLSRNRVQQTLELDVFLVDEPSEPALPGEILPAGSNMEVRQASRFAHPPVEFARRVAYPSFVDEMMAMTATTSVRFPRYDPADALDGTALANGGYFVWRIEPNVVDNLDRAPLLQMITVPQSLEPVDDDGNPSPCIVDADCCDEEDGDCSPNRCLPNGECTLIGDPHFTAEVRYHAECDRTLLGNVLLVRPDGVSSPLAGATVQLRYAELEDEPRLGVKALTDRVVTCSADADCLPGQICDVPPFGEARECLLPLAGRAANAARDTAPDDPATPEGTGSYEISVYTYCDPELALPLLRAFTANVVPPSEPISAHPTTNHTLASVSFGPQCGAEQCSPATAPPICVPDWGPPVQLELQLRGEPAVLVGAGADAIACCDVGCLPRTMLDASTTDIPTPSSCSGSTVGGALASIVVETSAVLTTEERAVWTALACAMPQDEDAPIGALTRRYDCAGDDDSPCIRDDLAAGPDGTPRTYSVRIESPVGSVLRSRVLTDLAIDGTDATRVQAIDLQPRAILRGRVRLDDASCDPETAAQTGCGSEGAIVLAERLRMPSDPATTIGPYFHEVETFFDPLTSRPGGYVLPLDPGVYLVTALPASGSIGGPADLHVVDLRDEASLETELDLVLRAGVFVTLKLDTEKANGFDPRSVVTPLDLGSWIGRLSHPDLPAPIDLNRIDQCFTAEGSVGCKIRRLIPSTSLTTSAVGQVQFTARTAGDAAACE